MFSVLALIMIISFNFFMNREERSYFLILLNIFLANTIRGSMIRRSATFKGPASLEVFETPTVIIYCILFLRVRS